MIFGARCGNSDEHNSPDFKFHILITWPKSRPKKYLTD
jgi:hypothetical protein